MRIDLNSIDRTQFMVHEHIMAGEPLYLVQPQHIGAEWTEDNLIFRSSLWNAKGEPVSLSWKKHFNWDEKPDIDPAPASLVGAELIEKIDGSTLLFSRYHDTLIVRTRGTVDATKLDNGDEIELFKQRYPALFKLANYDGRISPANNRSYSTVVCEWVSPRNRIVIPYPEPDLYLTGIIDHRDYSYFSQDQLDEIAKLVGLKRPRRYQFDTIPQMLATVDAFEGVEGICVYYNKGQSWRKAKAAAYLRAHRFKENVTVNNMLDLFFQYGRPDAIHFLDRIHHEFDWECRQLADSLIWQISNAYTKVMSRYHLMAANQIEPLRALSRREAAEQIIKTFEGHWKGVAFNILDNKVMDDKTLRKLMEEELDKSS